MVEARKDNETAFPIKFFIFDKLVHRGSSLSSLLNCGLRLTIDLS